MNGFMLMPAIRTVLIRYMQKLSGSLDTFVNKIQNTDLLTKQEKEILVRNSELVNKHKGDRCFIIANGPSLGSQDLSLLKTEITFTVNGFWKHPVVKEWQPTYHSVIDKAFFTDEEKIKEFWKNITSNIPSSTFFIPLLRGYEANRKHLFTPFDQTYYIATSGPPSPKIDLTKLMQGFQSCSAIALALAIYMGCNPIYLIGFDHDYLAYRGIDHHFYSGPIVRDHKHGVVPLTELSSFESEIKSMLKLWSNYKSLSIAAAKKNIQIFNATEGGYLDLFERRSYSSLFE